MADAYSIKDQFATHYVTFTVHQWVDVFTRKAYVDILLDSLRHCQQHKGLKIYAWVVMSNHCHLILRTEGFKLSDVIRDFKKHTAKKIMEAIEQNERESRKGWLTWLLRKTDMFGFGKKATMARRSRAKSSLIQKPVTYT